MLSVRTADGTTVLLPTFPILRLRRRRSNGGVLDDDVNESPPTTPSVARGAAAPNNDYYRDLHRQLPGDTLRQILSFLSPHSTDWLAAYSTCRSWYDAVAPLWGTTRRRTNALALSRASCRMERKWRSLRAFIPPVVRSALRGPATEADIVALKRAVRPFAVPPSLVASLLVHDGEDSRGSNIGLYGGCRLLSSSEMTAGVNQWKEMEEKMTCCCPTTMVTDEEGRGKKEKDVVSQRRIPLFAEDRARQIVMELRSDEEPFLNGRVVTINPSLPFAPYFVVLDGDWEGFLTLI